MIVEKLRDSGAVILGKTNKAYLDALAKNHKLAREQGIDAAVKKFKLDALIAPTRVGLAN